MASASPGGPARCGMLRTMDAPTASADGPAAGPVRGPMAWVPPYLRAPVFGVLSAVTVLLLGVQVFLDRSLQPYGIVGLELAGTAERAGLILVAWGDAGRVAAAFGLGLDMAFAVAYAGTLAMACEAVAGTGSGLRRRLGRGLAWGVVAAGLLDLVENVALARVLLAGDLVPWARIAAVAAVPKFLLVGAALAFVLAGVVAAALRR